MLTDPAGTLQAAFRRYPRSAPMPHCEMSHYVPLPASVNWAKGLTPEQSCPRALDGTWFMVSMSSPVLSLSSLLRLQTEPQLVPGLITMATAVLTVVTHTPTTRIQLEQSILSQLDSRGGNWDWELGGLELESPSLQLLTSSSVLTLVGSLSFPVFLLCSSLSSPTFPLLFSFITLSPPCSLFEHWLRLNDHQRGDLPEVGELEVLSSPRVWGELLRRSTVRGGISTQERVCILSPRTGSQAPGSKEEPSPRVKAAPPNRAIPDLPFAEEKAQSHAPQKQ